MRAYERLIKYAMVPTASNENSAAVPTTECQFNLAHILVNELQEMGVKMPESMTNAMFMPAFPLHRATRTAKSWASFPIWIPCPILQIIWYSRSSMKTMTVRICRWVRADVRLK